MSKLLKAGEVAPNSGLYRVTHYQHRMPHAVSVREGTTLPRCQKCGDRVVFEYLNARSSSDALDRDSDFDAAAHS